VSAARPRGWRPLRVAAGGAALALAAAGCGGDDPNAGVVRGRGLQPAALPPAAEARVYMAALGAAFELGPSLSLLLHPRRLPRTAGLAGGDPVPAAVVAALQQRDVIRGRCEPPLDESREPPTCQAAGPGYVVRGSDVFRVAGDTVQLHLAAERYRTPNGDPQEALSFEKVYKLAGSGSAWQVVGEARVP
jgi:hypothetical protein